MISGAREDFIFSRVVDIVCQGFAHQRKQHQEGPLIAALKVAFLVCIEPLEGCFVTAHPQIKQHIENGTIFLVESDCTRQGSIREFAVIILPCHNADQDTCQPVIRSLKVLYFDRLGDSFIANHSNVQIVHHSLNNFSDSPVVCKGGVRPVLIIQNDIGNRHSPTVIVAAITSRIKHHRLPTHVNLNGRQCGLHNESTIMLEQLRTLDKQRLLGYAGTVGKGKMREVNTALEISIGIKNLLPDNKRKRGSNYGKSEHREEKHQADPDDH